MIMSFYLIQYVFHEDAALVSNKSFVPYFGDFE